MRGSGINSGRVLAAFELELDANEAAVPDWTLCDLSVRHSLVSESKGTAPFPNKHFAFRLIRHYKKQCPFQHRKAIQNQSGGGSIILKANCDKPVVVATRCMTGKATQSQRPLRSEVASAPAAAINQKTIIQSQHKKAFFPSRHEILYSIYIYTKSCLLFT